MTTPAVLDASAALAYLLHETGGEKVKKALPAAIMSAVNLCEVLNKIGKHTGIENAGKAQAKLGGELYSVEPFLPDDAVAATAIYIASRHLGLSLGDCICLSLGQKLNSDVWTCDRNWAKLDACYRVIVIR